MIARSFDRRPLRVLAVDDEPALGKIVARLLGAEGHTVVCTSSAEDAIAELEREPFDVVLADLKLGPHSKLTGWDLAAEVSHRWPQIRFVLATGWGPQINPSEARAKGVAAVVSKPYKLSELRDVVTAGR